MKAEVRRHYDAAQTKLENMVEAARAAYPVGSEAQYHFGLGTRTVMILEHAEPTSIYTPRTYVQGVTGRRYWIDMSSLV